METPTHKDLIEQTSKIINNYAKCDVNYISKTEITIVINDGNKLFFDDEKRAGDYLVGYAGGLIHGMELMLKRNKEVTLKLFNLL